MQDKRDGIMHLEKIWSDANGPIFVVVNDLAAWRLITKQTVHFTLIPDEV